MAPGALDAEDLSYTLKGVIVHISPYSQAGHYVAFVKCRGQWFRCDDSVITEEKEHVVLSQNVYMVIYERNRVQDHTQKCTDAEFKAKADRAEPAGPDESPSEESGGEAGMVAGEVAPSASTTASEVADGGAAIQVVGEEGSEVGGGVRWPSSASGSLSTRWRRGRMRRRDAASSTCMSGCRRCPPKRSSM